MGEQIKTTSTRRDLSEVTEQLASSRITIERLIHEISQLKASIRISNEAVEKLQQQPVNIQQPVNTTANSNDIQNVQMPNNLLK